MARTPAQIRRAGSLASARYIANCPYITCPDCGEWARQYGLLPVCRNCYTYQRRTGRRRRKRHSWPRNWRYCLICLEEFWPALKGSIVCSYACSNALMRLKSYCGRHAWCQRCGRWRVIRAKCLCASCYVLARLEMNKAGLFGACAVRMNRWKGVPGVLNPRKEAS